MPLYLWFLWFHLPKNGVVHQWRDDNQESNETQAAGQSSNSDENKHISSIVATGIRSFLSQITGSKESHPKSGPHLLMVYPGSGVIDLLALTLILLLRHSLNGIVINFGMPM